MLGASTRTLKRERLESDLGLAGLHGPPLQQAFRFNSHMPSLI